MSYDYISTSVNAINVSLNVELTNYAKGINGK